MTLAKMTIEMVLPTDVIGRSVAHSKRWLVAIVRIHHEKKTSERLTKWALKISFLSNKKFITGVTVARLSTESSFQ